MILETIYFHEWSRMQELKGAWYLVGTLYMVLLITPSLDQGSELNQSPSFFFHDANNIFFSSKS